MNGVNLTGANLTNANLTRVKLEGAYGWSTVTLTGANLTAVDLRFYAKGTDLSGLNLTGTILADVDLGGSSLKNTNLTNAVLTGANIINTDLSGVEWADTACPRGGKSSTGCSPFPTEPAATFDTENKPWYNYRSDATSVIPSTALQGSVGAPIQNYGPRNNLPGNDGVQGMAKNNSNKRILVRIVYNPTGDVIFTPVVVEGILEPGDQMPFQLRSNAADEGKELRFFAVDENGRAVGNPAVYYLNDPITGRPDTAFTPPGRSEPVSVRDGWREGESHYEVWGTTTLWVKRENDGWSVPVSAEYLARYSNPNTSKTSDWAIFTVQVDSI
jgi:hypothetical protein